MILRISFAPLPNPLLTRNVPPPDGDPATGWRKADRSLTTGRSRYVRRSRSKVAMASTDSGWSAMASMTASGSVRWCAPARTVATASRDGTDLVVVGHRGISGVTRVFLGSVSEHVTTHAPCSVIVARPRDRREA